MLILGKDIGVTLPELLFKIVEVIPPGCMMRIGMTNPPYIQEYLADMATILNHEVFSHFSNQWKWISDTQIFIRFILYHHSFAPSHGRGATNDSQWKNVLRLPSTPTKGQGGDSSTFWTHRPLGGWSYRLAAARLSVHSSVRLSVTSFPLKLIIGFLWFFSHQVSLK